MGALGEWLSYSFRTKSTWVPTLLDGAGLNEALDAEIAVIGLVAHGAELGDGDVVALIGAVAGKGEPGHCAEDDDDGDADAESFGSGASWVIQP